MRIHVQADGHKFAIRLPNWLLTSPLGWKFVSTQIAKNVSSKSQGQSETIPPPLPSSKNLRELKRVLKKFKKQPGGFTLVDVETEDGERVKITL
jgi:hypothetical protein